MKPISWILAAVAMGAIVGYVVYLDRRVPVPEPNAAQAVATFAGGCFWCTEAAFEGRPGVSSVTSGYVGHREAVRVIFDPDEVTYQELLGLFWRNVDPTDPGGQFVDRGSAYTTAIFYHTTTQRREAQASLDAMAQSGRFGAPIVTEILPVDTFYAAAASHQDFHRRSPVRYRTYRRFSGRREFLQEHWPATAPEPEISRRASP